MWRCGLFQLASPARESWSEVSSPESTSTYRWCRHSCLGWWNFPLAIPLHLCIALMREKQTLAFILGDNLCIKPWIPLTLIIHTQSPAKYTWYATGLFGISSVTLKVWAFFISWVSSAPNQTWRNFPLDHSADREQQTAKPIRRCKFVISCLLNPNISLYPHISSYAYSSVFSWSNITYTWWSVPKLSSCLLTSHINNSYGKTFCLMGMWRKPYDTSCCIALASTLKCANMCSHLLCPELLKPLTWPFYCQQQTSMPHNYLQSSKTPESFSAKPAVVPVMAS